MRKWYSIPAMIDHTTPAEVARLFRGKTLCAGCSIPVPPETACSYCGALTCAEGHGMTDYRGYPECPTCQSIADADRSHE